MPIKTGMKTLHITNTTPPTYSGSMKMTDKEHARVLADMSHLLSCNQKRRTRILCRPSRSIGCSTTHDS